MFLYLVNKVSFIITKNTGMSSRYFEESGTNGFGKGVDKVERLKCPPAWGVIAGERRELWLKNMGRGC
jgi:hypothetical protein